MPDIGLFEAIYSARSIRRLKPDPVPEELITKVPLLTVMEPVTVLPVGIQPYPNRIRKIARYGSVTGLASTELVRRVRREVAEVPL